MNWQCDLPPTLLCKLFWMWLWFSSCGKGYLRSHKYVLTMGSQSPCPGRKEYQVLWLLMVFCDSCWISVTLKLTTRVLESMTIRGRYLIVCGWGSGTLAKVISFSELWRGSGARNVSISVSMANTVWPCPEKLVLSNSPRCPEMGG